MFDTVVIVAVINAGSLTNTDSEENRSAALRRGRREGVTERRGVKRGRRERKTRPQAAKEMGCGRNG
jgi:hypothetical protein